MSAPGFPDACAPLVKAMADIATAFNVLRDQLMEIHNSAVHPDAVRMRVAEALDQVDEGQRFLALEGEE